MPKAVSFSQASLKSIELPEKGRVEYADSSTPHLLLRVSSTGCKTFYWFGRVGRTLKREKIGTWPEMGVAFAKREAARLSGLKAVGRPVVSKRTSFAKEWTLGELFGWYLENHSKPHKRTWKWDQRMFELKLARWANRPVSSITRMEFQAYHLEVGKTSGPYAANEMLQVARHMYRLGALADPLRVPCPDPTAGIKRFPREERERFLDADELPKFLSAVAQLQREPSRDFFMLCLWTGARRSNVCQMRWDEISLDAGTWTIPKEKSKNKKPMQIVLSPPALEILQRRAKAKRSPWVLPGKGDEGHYNDPKAAWARIRELSGLVDIRIHDLRRTLGSWMAIDHPLQVVGKQLGHSSIRSTQVYARLANQTLKDAVGSATSAMLDTQKQKAAPKRTKSR